MKESVQLFEPSEELKLFVENYRLRVGQSPEGERAPLVFPSRTAQFLEFYLGDPVRVMQDGSIEDVPRVVLVGTQAVRRLELFIGQQSKTFTIMFRPTGFLRLFGVPLSDLAGQGVPAEDLLGSSVRGLYESFGECRDAGELVKTANDFLAPHARAASPDVLDRYQPIEQSLASVAKGPKPFSVDRLVEDSMFSHRQFERLFKQATGVAPKRYLRVMRLNHALDVKRRNPQLAWGSIALDLGYFDQMHLVHDFRALGGEPPSALLLSTSQPKP